MTTDYTRLEDVILDDAFPELDLALRRGRHIDREDADWYTLLTDGQSLLETFYRRYGCELIYRSDGYFYLLPTNDRLGRRHLSSSEMLVGQALTLLYLDPATVEQGGVVTKEQILEHLAGVMGADSLIRALNPKRKKYDERVAQETVRNKVSEGIRRLATLGFVELLEENRIRLRPSLMRFAEPVRAAGAPEAALERLVAQGELVLADPESAGPEEEDDEELEGPESAPSAVMEAPSNVEVPTSVDPGPPPPATEEAETQPSEETE